MKKLEAYRPLPLREPKPPLSGGTALLVVNLAIALVVLLLARYRRRGP